MNGQAASPEFATYLDSLPARVGEELATAARALWSDITRVVSSDAQSMPEPSVVPSESDGRPTLTVVWDRQEHHLEIDLYAVRRFDWFYRNRETESVLGTEEDGGDFEMEAFWEAVFLIANIVDGGVK